MKLAQRAREKVMAGISSTPAINQSKKMGYIIVIGVVTLLLIIWVMYIGAKAERTVEVVMLASNVHKNQMITEDLLKPYDVLLGEYEKYTVVEENGTKKRRLILWEERGKILNSFAAYPLKRDTYAEYRDFVKSRVNNTDTVLYSFPGKEIVPLEISSAEMSAFKTFLKPGDKLNIEGVFEVRQNMGDSYGLEQIEVFKSETVFGGILVADMLNSKGESILDIYSSYRELSVWEQAQLDNSSEFRIKTEPKTLLVALTPDEKERYYYYLSKSNIKFKASMPQRIN